VRSAAKAGTEGWKFILSDSRRNPVQGRFLSPDNYIQDPFNTQNYNRYGYVLNNPLMYTDANGEFIFTAAVLIGVAVGAYFGGSMANGNYNPFKWDWG